MGRLHLWGEKRRARLQVTAKGCNLNLTETSNLSGEKLFRGLSAFRKASTARIRVGAGLLPSRLGPNG